MSGLVGRTLDRYEIVSLLGAGGMGAVYQARDTAMGRDVAIKVLPEPPGENSTRIERFNREIRTVARLSHPNIVEIYDHGVSDGVVYAVMELLKGKNLRDRMRGRALPLQTALDVGVAVANALGEAHHQGVLHRDVKPENIFVTSNGGVKVLDFGLARDVCPTDSTTDTKTYVTSLTSEGSVVGTTGYMSPEQVRGLSLDARSDIFSLGCVLYEILSGVHPFRGETRADTQSAILNVEPQELTQLRPELPPMLDLVVERCLRKDPDERFESAKDVAFAIQALSQSRSSSQPAASGTVAVPRRALRLALVVTVMAAILGIGVLVARRLVPPDLPSERRLAVLQFESEGNGTDFDAFAAGLRETVADGLTLVDQSAGVTGWTVPSDGLRVGFDQLEELRRTYDLNEAVLGTVGRAGDRLTLDLEVIDPQTGRRLRSSLIEDGLGNLGSFQAGPVLRLAELLDLPLDDAVRRRLENRSTNVIAAFESGMQGLGRLAVAESEGAVDQAIDNLSRAVELDPHYGSARVALARAYLQQYELGGGREWIDRGLEQTELALAQGAVTTDALMAAAALKGAVGAHADAVTALERVVDVAPNDGEAQLLLARELEKDGRLDEAERRYQHAIFLRPGYWPAHYWLALFYKSQGRYDAAINEFNRVIAVAPDYAGGYNNLGMMFMYLGDNDRARVAFEQSLAVDDGANSFALSNLGLIYYSGSRFDDSVRMFERSVEIDKEADSMWGNLAFAYEAAGDPERAEQAFRRAIELGEVRLLAEPDNTRLLCELAGYFAALGEQEKGIAVLERAVATGPTDPQLVADIAEAFEDLGDREQALSWVGRAFDLGVSPSRFEGRPSLRGLLADERYRTLAASAVD